MTTWYYMSSEQARHRISSCRSILNWLSSCEGCVRQSLNYLPAARACQDFSSQQIYTLRLLRLAHNYQNHFCPATSLLLGRVIHFRGKSWHGDLAQALTLVAMIFSWPQAERMMTWKSLPSSCHLRISSVTWCTRYICMYH